MEVIETPRRIAAMKTTFALTSTETRICELLMHGNTRDDLKRLLGVNENCLKWHLKNLYAKTIGDEALCRDKLHRLTQFLYRQAGDETTLEGMENIPEWDIKRHA